ncbi:MAG: prephenate dehydrogenase/arogenate dehydrogenase family protein, partial [Deltaproteobacteria bacterium]|nr:prephenate dehydrogenase/arogenate dehydrogenase family protein [Deltaproteobacteria bacterium]
MSILFRQLTICGVGLIGGSFALNARRHRLVERIVGLGRSQANLDTALARGLIDFATRDPAEAAHRADLVMLATPIMTFSATLAAMIPHLPPDSVVTDVGSVKTWVVEQLEPLLKSTMSFVGVHPVAGKETTGAAAAQEDLFVNQRVIVTPSPGSHAEAIEKVEALWRATG